jgi:concanavalin A-like lectin/glucanase superfamily protein
MARRCCEVLGIWAVAALAGCSTAAAADAELAEIRSLLHDEVLPELDVTPSVIALSRPPSGSAIGHWRFDDCDAGRAELGNAGDDQLDAAYRSAGVRCSDGVLGQAIAFAAREAIVYVPDQPYVAFARGVTVAAWFRPSGVEGTQTLFRKRAGGGSAFALVIHGGRFRFAIDLGDGGAASVASPEPARPGVFQHVAASYDGRTLRLYVDGREVATRAVAGAIPAGPGSLLIGNDGAGRRFDGAVDDAVFDLRALTAQQVLELTCIPVAPLVVATPGTTAPTLPDVPVAFDIAVTNRNPPACAAMDFALEARTIEPGVAIDPDPGFQERPVVRSGTTAHFGFTATPFDAVDTGSFAIGFDVFSLGWGFTFSGAVHLVVAAPAGCHVIKSRELMITDLSVVQDPARTAGGGVWSFQHLAEQAAAGPGDAPAMIEDLLRSYTARQQIDGAALPPRPGMNRFLDAWPRTGDGRLDLARSPLQLQAIVDRIDLRDLARGTAGHASFVFAFVEDGFQLPATLMFEYDLPAASEADVLAWAQAFHALGGVAFSEPYNAALAAITEAFVRRGARPGAVNDSALHAVLSSEAVFGADRQLRSFALSPATGRLVPGALDGADGARPPAITTCRGCHSVAETGAALQHIAPRFSRGEVSLSPFLRGVTVADPMTGERRRFNDLGRRADDLAALVCPAVGAPRASVGRGIRRVH